MCCPAAASAVHLCLLLQLLDMLPLWRTHCARASLLPSAQLRFPTSPHLPPNQANCSYDPSKFAEVDKLGDRGMEAGFTQVQEEERRAARIARAEDER